MGICGMYFEQQRRRLWHETARLALEKGQPLPPSIDAPAPENRRGYRPARDIRRGLVLMSVGVGLYFFLGHVAPDVATVGAIPGLIGVALLLFGLFSRFALPQAPTDDDRLPRK